MPLESGQVVSSAPGKLVLTGEYAVLCGAPAIVAAVNRRVRVEARTATSGGWRVVSQGFDEVLTGGRDDVFAQDASSTFGLIGTFMDERSAPEHAEIRIDSSECYSGPTKLGVGSSAAVTVALAAAVRRWQGTSIDLETLIDGHRTLQGGGSGLDVATSYLGGVVRFQERRAHRIAFDTGVHLGFVFTGSSTRTLDLVAIFDAWRSKPSSRATTLNRFLDAAERVADCTGNAQAFMASLRQYIGSLNVLDREANIGIYGPGHARARTLAEAHDVLYKPCGAGGGDCGVVVATNRAAVDRFLAAARGIDLVPLPAEVATDGVTVATH